NKCMESCSKCCGEKRCGEEPVAGKPIKQRGAIRMSRSKPSFSRALAGICLLSIFASSFSYGQFFRVPAAEVPEIVKMPRPTEAQLVQAEASRQAMLAGLAAADRAVFDTYPYLLQITPRPAVNSAIVPN